VVLTTPNATANSEHGPTIYDNHGQVVWYQPMPYKRTWDLSVVTYRDQRMLAVYVQGPRLPSGFARPQYLLLDRHYRIAARIPARNGYSADLHELEITSHGRAYVGAYNQVLDPVSGHPTLEYVVQQVDIASGDLLFEWHSLDHVPARASYLPRPQGTVAWDYFHGNSIERLPGGNLIISARNTSTLYEISGQTGQVLWRMGGKEDDFDLVSRHPGWQFCFQYDARRRGPGSLTVFDNGGEGPGCPRHVSRVEVFRLRPEHHVGASPQEHLLPDRLDRRRRLLRSCGRQRPPGHQPGLVRQLGSSPTHHRVRVRRALEVGHDVVPHHLSGDSGALAG
jgi:hypothetical protein